MMKRCSKRAYALCPYKHECGTIKEAIFAENSECDKFNRGVDKLPMTNAEQIRAMSVEELAGIIMCPYGSEPDLCCTKGTCLDCCEQWLKQPVENSDG